VLGVYREDGTLAIEDEAGIVFMYGHMDSILPAVQTGAKVARGAPVGIVGRKGGSGTSRTPRRMYPSAMPSVLISRCGIQLLPVLVEAYRQATGMRLLAVARPHVAALTGEAINFDATRSRAFGSTIASYRWEFPGGVSATGARTEKTFDAPGTYAVALWVEDGRGGRDVDFATVRVFTREKLEGVMPTLFLTYTPSRTVHVGDEVFFRLWPQGREITSIRLDFGAEGVVEGVEPFAPVTRRFKTPASTSSPRRARRAAFP